MPRSLAPPAWLAPLPLASPLSRACGLPARCARRARWQACNSAPLSAAERAAADAAARVTYLLATSASSRATAADLVAFCGVKGVATASNPWDRDTLLAAALKYAAEERAARTCAGPAWDALPDSAKVRLLHRVCNAEGDVTYADPRTGYTVFTFFGHLKRGDCCGVGTDGRSHRCRHCPYTEAGEVANERMAALMRRVRVVEYARRRAQEMWTQGGFGESEGVQAGGQEEAVEGEVAAAVAVVAPAAVESRAAVGILSANAGVAGLNALVKVKRIERVEKNGPCECVKCQDQKVMTCTRCNGWTYMFSPQIMKCPQCSAKGYHPCMSCTPFRPPSRASFYS